jgi:hypothetical protein
MREAQYTKILTIALQPELFSKIKDITDRERISIGEWFREAAERALVKSNDMEEQEHDGRTIHQE